MEDAKKRRAAVKGWLSRELANLRQLVARLGVSKSELTNALADFDKRQKKLEIVQEELELLFNTEEELLADIDTEHSFHNVCRSAKAAAESKLLELQKQDATFGVHANESAHNHQTVAANLPKIEMASFSGDYTEWPSFFDGFQALIEQTSLPDITKFNYLQSLLSGEALSCIKGLSLTADNYRHAVDILKERYDRKERIIFDHIQKLLATEVNVRSVSNMWAFYNQVQSHIRSLANFGIIGEQYGVILTPLILSRLPSDIRMEWARASDKRESDLSFLMEFLCGEIQRRERSENFDIRNTSPRVQQVQQERKKNTASALVSSDNSRVCVFCDRNNHYSDKCLQLPKMEVQVIRQKVKDNNLCFKCFRPSHLARNCKLQCSLCHKSHNKLFCQRRQVTDRQNKDNQSGGSDNCVIYARSEFTGRQTVMQTCKLRLKGVDVFVLFDSAADKSYISSSCVKSLKPKFIGKEESSFCSFGGGRSSERKERNVYEITFDGVNGEKAKVCLTEISEICNTMYRPKVPLDCLSQFRFQMGRDLDWGDDFQKGQRLRVDVLIGLDHYWQLIKPGKVLCSDVGLVAQETIFGKWILSGSWPSSQASSRGSHTQFLTLGDVRDSTVKRFWELEAIGISDDSSGGVNQMGNPVWEEFRSKVKFVGNRYEVSLPWKDGELRSRLQNNFQSAKCRHERLDRKLGDDTRYAEVFETLEREGIVHEVPSDEMEPEDRPVYYIPHFPVIKESSVSTKVRPVFDASCAGSNGISLNDCVHSGPNLLPNLTEILLRFRRWPVALTADIKKAFLQIRLKKEDQDVQRFLLKEGQNLRIMRCERVIFGCTSSPFLLIATINYHLDKYEKSRVVEEMQDNFYMDDLLTGADDIDQACEMQKKASEIMSEASMQLCKWNSNSQAVKERLQKDFRDDILPQSDVTKILGLKWDPKADVFEFTAYPVPTYVVVTKRLVLSLLSRIFDPLGFLSPYTITAKIIFQELWKLGVHWDEEIPNDLRKQFLAWIQDLSLLQTWTVPRCLVSCSWLNKESLEIHCFCDASEKGYCTAVYLKVKEQDGREKMSLVIAKSRVAPVKQVTLPRLELLGCVLGARLLRFVIKSLHLPEETSYKCWTDSTVALHWIRSESSKWKTFVSNRVSEIQRLTSPDRWQHCRGSDNPADLGTRGISAKKLIHSPEWIVGPYESVENESEENQDQEIEEVNSICSSECQETALQISTTSIEPLLPFERWGGFSKAVRIVAWVLRFIANSRQKCAERNSSKSLSVEEIRDGKRVLLKTVQTQYFAEEMKQLRLGGRVSKGSPLRKLNPFIGENGLLRVQGRLQFMSASFECKHPIILPKCHVSELLIRREHLELKHAGVPHMISSIRNEFWIIGLRTLARKVKRQCVRCARYDALACQQPIAPLPEERISRSDPFSVTGVDFCGPIFTSDLVGIKHYICLFTCGVVRGIHLELVDNLTVQQFMMAFKRFVSRRRMPVCVLSDNAKTFQAAARKLAEEYADRSPKWKFIKPRSPWVGGIWERLVRSVKTSLKKSISTRCLTKSELITLLCEIEMCINNRPLTFVGDTLDSWEALTPNHFLTGGNIVTGVSNSSPRVVTANDLRQMAMSQSEKFWSVWSQSYVKELPHAPMAKARGKLKLGDVVIIREDNCPRLYWPLGKVTKRIPSKDKLIRTVEVKTKKGLLIRPIQRLHLLELDNRCDVSTVADSQLPESDDDYDLPIITRGHSSLDPGTSTSTTGVKTRAGRSVKPKQVLDL